MVLEDEGANPGIIGGNGHNLLAELGMEPRVVVRGLLVRQKHGTG